MDKSAFHNQDGTLKCFGHADFFQEQKPHQRNCIAMIEELKLCNETLRKECLKISKRNNPAIGMDYV